MIARAGTFVYYSPMNLRPTAREELRIFNERYMHFMNLWTVYSDLLKKKYIPSLDLFSDNSADVQMTLMFVLYAFFYTLIEDSDDGLNGFRLWREFFPEEETAIAAVEARVSPFADRLKSFRNRLGFHGSRSRAHELRGFELFSKHSGDELWDGMKIFKALGAALMAKDGARTASGE